jgi:signal transduction histidine kinase
MARGEETYVEQIIRNLVGNAIKYGPRDGTVIVRAAAEDGAIVVRVLDEGPGIAPGEANRVFDLLYRSPATAAQAAGSGIGLFVSRRLAEAMGGTLLARPRRKGSEFVLRLLPYREPGGGAD